MKKAVKWIGIVVGVLLIAIGGLVIWVETTWSVDHPATPLPAIKASSDPAVIAEGEYVVNAIAHCSTCHAPAAMVEARKLDVSQPPVGGYKWEMGPFGTFVAANLTPHATGIGSMSDGEIARVVRHGVGRDGKFAPMMGLSVGHMSDQDLTAVISYLRTLKPVEAERPRDQFGFLARALSGVFVPRLTPAPEHVSRGTISVERGRYLAEGPAVCAGCHTPVDPMAGFAPSGPSLSGAGMAEPDATEEGYEFAAPNLTPDPKTGHIAKWSEDDFVKRLNDGRTYRGSHMPWEAFGRMTDEDKRSIYRYLQTLPPAVHEVGPTRRKAGSFKAASL